MNAPNPIPPKPVQVPGTNTLLIGGPGTGKTHAIRTLADAGLEVFCVLTEPMGTEVLGDTDPTKVHWKYRPAAAPSWAMMLDSAKKINTMTFEDLAKLKTGISKQGYGQYIELLNTLSNFKCDRTGEEFGPVDSFDNTKAIVVDSLSGINIMAMDLVVGSKPVKAMGDWGVAMDNEERLINKLCGDTTAFFVLIAHAEMERDEIVGTNTIMAGALGRKLAPKIPRFFSDVVHTKRVGDKFVWSTATQNMDCKARTLPWADNQEPSFVPIVKAWKAKQEKLAVT